MDYLDCIKCKDQIFTSIDTAKAEISKNHTQENIQLSTPTSPRKFATAPKYLFRGESGTWVSSLSSMQRIRDGIDPLTSKMCPKEAAKAFEEIKELALLAGQYVKEATRWDQMTAAGFLQHYEMPSEFLDFTASLQTALGFALWNVGSKNTKPMVVYLCVAKTETLSSKAVLPDFAALMQGAKRPSLQQGYGVFGNSQDLKDPEAIKSLGLRWYAIHATFADLAENSLDPSLLDLASDETAGFMKWVLDLAVEDRGGLTDPIAAYLAEKVAAVEPIKKDMGNGKSEYISHSQAGRAFNARAQQAKNYNDWRRTTAR